MLAEYPLLQKLVQPEDTLDRFQSWTQDMTRYKTVMDYWTEKNETRFQEQVEHILTILLSCDSSSVLRNRPFWSEISSHPRFDRFFRMYVTRRYQQVMSLNEEEALMLARCVQRGAHVDLLSNGIASRLIEPTYTLGSLLETSTNNQHLTLAYEIYCEGTVFEKILDMSLRLENYRVALEVIIRTFEVHELRDLMLRIDAQHSSHVVSAISLLLLQ
jgi:hypothetical protein